MSIQERQNRPESLAVLAAQRLRYGHAKRLRNTSIGLVLLVAILGLVASVVDDESFSYFLPFVALVMWFIDQQVLKRTEAKVKAEAAAIQEQFDCLVLDLPWPAHKAIQRPTADRVSQLAAAAKRKSSISDNLEDWYAPRKIPNDPLLAKIHCQRMNCWWDVNLRYKWSATLEFAFWSFSVSLLLLSVLTGTTVAKVVAIGASNIRVLAWGLGERHDQKEAIRRVNGIHNFLSNFPDDKPPSLSDIRSVQDEIFEHRRSNPPVPEWFYSWKRESQEREAAGKSGRDTAQS